MAIEKKSPLSLSFLEGRKEALKKLAGYDNALDDRITYIVEKILEVFGEEFSYWHYSNEEEDFDRANYGDQINITIERENDRYNSLVLVLNGGEWGLADSIPSRWLTEDFEQELEDGLNKYIASLEEKKQKAKKSKETKAGKKKAALEQIKAKLTPEELKLLKIK